MPRGLGDSIRLRADTRDFERVAKALREAGDRKINLAVSRAFREVAKPLGEKVARDGNAAMPSRGGLRAALESDTTVRVRTTLSGRRTGSTLTIGSSRGRLALLDRGFIRHPVYGRADRERRSWAWTTQRVPEGQYTKAFRNGAPMVRDALLVELRRISKEIAK